MRKVTKTENCPEKWVVITSVNLVLKPLKLVCSKNLKEFEKVV
jgi:hypothetical protein